MAFVYEVERPPLFPINKVTSEIGPGQYLPLTSYKFEKPNSVPFNITSKRIFPFDKNSVPGPGSYNPKEEQNIANPKLMKEKEIKDNNKTTNDNGQLIKNKFKILKKKNVETEKYENKEKLGFFTKVERFKIKMQEDTPGPGAYDDKNILLAKSIEEECNNKKELIFKINIDRRNVFHVNRDNNQFPWNAEVTKPIKKSKSKSEIKCNKCEKSFGKTEKIKMNNTSLANIINNIKDLKKINSSKYRENKQEIKDNKENRTDLNFFVADKNENKINNDNNTEEHKNIHKAIPFKKSKTSSNFYLPDTGGSKLNYSKESKKKIKEKLEAQMNLSKAQNDIKYRICSIPSKFCSGYNIEKESGKVVRNPIKTSFKIFSGEKDDAVGPGSYEINLPELWRKTGTCWSKYLCEKEPLKKRPNSGNDSNDQKLINQTKLDKWYKKIVKKINIEENRKNVNVNIPNIYRLSSTQQLSFKDPSMHKIHELNATQKDQMPFFIQINDVPGPGYYYDEEKKDYNINNKKNYFGNVKKNYHVHENLIKKDKGGLGPGTYFNDNNNKKIMSKEKNNSAPFLCKSKRFIYDKSLILNNNKNDSYADTNLRNLASNNNNISIESNPTSNSTHKFCVSKKDFIDSEQQTKNMYITTKVFNPKSLSGTFYRKDIRFRENVQEENRTKEIPGPGSYINPYTNTGKSNSVKIDDKYMDIRSCRQIIEKNRANRYFKSKRRDKNILCWLGETNEIKPCVGTYEPDKTMTILYNIKNNKKYGNNSFNSTQYSDRNGFYMFQKNMPNGPGCYYKDKIIENKQISAAFHSTANRFNKGGKNNTREFHKITKKALSVVVKKIDNKDGNKKEDNQTNDKKICVRLKEKIIKERKNVDLGIMNNSNTPNIVGPGTYNFLQEIYPWVKQSYNIKYLNN